MWQRSLDLVLLTHPHLDHFMGFHFVKDRYHIQAFAIEKLSNATPAFELFLKGFAKKNISQQFVSAGDSWQMGDGVEIRIVGPSQNYMERSSPGGTIGETKEFASLIMLVSYGSFKALLTGDSQAAGLEEAIALLEGEVTIVQAPHHGSASGLTTSIIEQLSPQTAVISVGKNNYGHPTLATLHLLQNVPIRRTDQEGDVEFVSDGY